MTVSYTVKGKYTCVTWLITAMRAAISRRFILRIGAPSSSTSPLDGISAAMARMSVVLPQPLGPRMQ